MTGKHGTDQPFLHELVSCVRAPTVAMSGPDGQLRPTGAQGLYDGDTRVLSRCELRVNSVEAEPLGHSLAGAGCAEFVGVLRQLGDPVPDPTVTLIRARRVAAGSLHETVCLRSDAEAPVPARLEIHLGVDLASMSTVKSGGSGSTLPAARHETGLRWQQAGRTVRAETTPAPDAVDADAAVIVWDLVVPARGEVEIALTVTTSGELGDDAFGPAQAERRTVWSTPQVRADDRRLPALLEQGLLDAESLLMADPQQPADGFLAAGNPWFLTLFGRDSLWAARMMLPVGTELARGTLCTLARRQGLRVDPSTEEQPGKILHEVRGKPAAIGGGTTLPTRYYGSVDATPLWICLLADAWRWGMPGEQVIQLLGPCEAALTWLVTYGDSDGDGFVEYVDSTGSGLANQGWKDSGDSIQWSDGRQAAAPLALCEVQAYAYQAAVTGADLLEAFGRPGTDRWRDWATSLRKRFHDQFWTEDGHGPFPAVALDADKRRVDAVTSNIGHLLGTGLLDAQESALVAGRLGSPEMDSGYGLRTLSAASPRFGPLTYHRGSVWPHDTAIVVDGLARDGHHECAAGLVAGLLAASTQFDQRLPELYSGVTNDPGRPLLAYPAACRPQAWAAVSAVGLLQSLLGLRPDVPGGELRVDPLRPAVAGAIAATGLRIAGEHLSVTVDSHGAVEVVAPSPLTVRTGRR